MSVQNKKRNVLIGFGAVAVVLVAVVAMWPPGWPSEDASGAIGAVQKHRETQITEKDVVLVDEQTRQEDAVVFADYLDDAAKLQNISAELSASLRDSDEALQGRATFARSSLIKHEEELQARYSAKVAATLSAMSRAVAGNEFALEASRKAQLQSEIDQLSAKMKGRAQLQAEEMEAFNVRLNNIDAELQAKGLAVRKAGGAQMESDLQGLESRRSLQNADLQNLESRLSSISRELNAKYNAKPQLTYLGALAAQSKAMQLGKADVSSMNFAKLSSRLASEADAMEAQATRNLQGRLSSDEELAARLEGISRNLAAARELASRNASTLDGRIQNSFQASLKNAEELVGARRAEYQAKLSGRIQNELSAIDRHLKSRYEMAARLSNEEQMASKLAAGKAQAMQARTVNAKLSNEEQLQVRKMGAMAEARAQLRGKLSSAAGFQKYLANVDQALNGSRQFASLAQRQQLALEARQLGARLEARSH